MNQNVLFIGFILNAILTTVGFVVTGKLNPITAIPATVLLWVALAVKRNQP